LAAGLQGVEGIVTRGERVSLVMTGCASWSVLRSADRGVVRQW
jgi:hypothetical protein